MLLVNIALKIGHVDYTLERFLFRAQLHGSGMLAEVHGAGSGGGVGWGAEGFLAGLVVFVGFDYFHNGFDVASHGISGQPCKVLFYV